MSSSFLSVEHSDSLANPGCEEPFQLPLFSLEDTFNISQPPLDLDNFYQPTLSPTAVVPNMYAAHSASPSPPPSSTTVPSNTPTSQSISTPNLNPNTPAIRKKRKKDAIPSPDEPLLGFDWQTYSSPAQPNDIFDQSGRPITSQFDLSMQKVEANTHYSANDNAWICYRQNQFKVICTLQSPHEEGTTYFVHDNGAPVAVAQFCAKLYAIKEINSAVGEEMRVGLHHVGKSRVKKEKLDIGIAPFSNEGRVEFANVQFERSNAVKGQQLEYFHLVLAFYAKSFSNTYYHIFSRMSMRLIVRSQNPGFYGDSPANAQAEVHEDNASNKSSPGSSPGNSHDSVSTHPSYNSQPAPILIPTPTLPSPHATQTLNSFPFNNTHNPNFVNTINPHEFAMHGNGNGMSPQHSAPPPPFQFQPQTIANPPPFIPTMVSNSGPNVNNVNNVINSSNNSIIRMNSTHINTTTTDIIYPNHNSANTASFSINNNNTFNPSNTYTPPTTTFGRDAQSTNAGVGGSWKSEVGPSNGGAPGPSSSRAPGGAGGGGNGGSGSGGSGSDGNRNGGTGEPAWQQFSDVVVHHGKVGINTFTPLEALTVNGNILVTGNVFKPSDMRIKSDITEVDSGSQLSNVRNLKIYDYIVRSQQERGVLAQELQAIMPQAVNNVGNVDNIPNFLVINERVLLFENIGATQQLDKELETEKQTIVEIDSRVAELKQTTAQENMEVKNKIRNLFDVLFAEESGDRTMLAGLEEEYLNIGFSIFKMGPPRSFFLVGFLFPFSWSLGALYVFSNISSRRIMGFSNLLMLISYLVLYFCAEFYMVKHNILTKVQVTWVGVGIILLLINYARMRSRLKKKMKQMDNARSKNKAHIKKQIDDVTQKNIDKMEKGEKRSKRKGKEPKIVLEVGEPIIVRTTSREIVTHTESREELTKEIPLERKDKKPIREEREKEGAGAVLHVSPEIEASA